MIEYSELELNVLPPDEMLQTLRLGIWKELYHNETEIDVYRRTLQREYLSRIHEFLSLNQIGGSRSSVDLKNSDIRPLMRTELILLKKDIKKHLDKGLGDGIQKAHLEDAIIRIEQLLQNDK